MASLVPRFVALPLLAVLATGTLTYAAERQLSAPAAPASPAAASVPSVLVVPDVRRQAFVFAKGTLNDGGFAWKVVGSVDGYAANTVASQSPAPGTRLVDTGAPLIELTLVANPRYGRKGTPENASPFPATAVKVAGAAEPAAAPVEEPAPAAEPAAQPAAPKAKPQPKAAARPAAFAVRGAPKEPLDEMPLPQRARALAKFVAAHPKPTDAAVKHYVYQHTWIVTGATFGWWRGAEALELLIAVDRQVQKTWGIGARSERTARAALERVRAKSK